MFLSGLDMRPICYCIVLNFRDNSNLFSFLLSVESVVNSGQRSLDQRSANLNFQCTPDPLSSPWTSTHFVCTTNTTKLILK